jgi:hypothetical protein
VGFKEQKKYFAVLKPTSLGLFCHSPNKLLLFGQVTGIMTLSIKRLYVALSISETQHINNLPF